MRLYTLNRWKAKEILATLGTLISITEKIQTKSHLNQNWEKGLIREGSICSFLFCVETSWSFCVIKYYKPGFLK